MIDYAYVMKSPQKIPEVGGLENFQVEHICVQGVTHPSSMGTEAPVLWTIPDFALCISSSGWSSLPFSYLLLYNKLSISVSQSSVSSFSK